MLVRLYKNDASIKGECVVYYDVENNKFYVPAGQAYTYKGSRYLTHTRVGISKTELRNVFFTESHFSINMGKGLVRLKDLDVDITVKHFDIDMRKKFVEECVPKSELFTLEDVMRTIKGVKNIETPEKVKKPKVKKPKVENIKAPKKVEESIPSVSEFNRNADSYVGHEEYDLVAMRRELDRLREDNNTLSRRCRIEKEYEYLKEQLREARNKNARLKGIIVTGNYSAYRGDNDEY